jgi:hypothetical protein
MSVTRSMRGAALMLLGLPAGLWLAVAAAHLVTPHPARSRSPLPTARAAW